MRLSLFLYTVIIFVSFTFISSESHLAAEEQIEINKYLAEANTPQHQQQHQHQQQQQQQQQQQLESNCNEILATMSTSTVASISRRIVQAVLSREQGEGMGATVRRSIGRPELRNLDPFLMLDEFKSGPPAGFPDHPHRGFETVSYMLSGAFEHEDFTGRRGVINPGDLQWMTAGRGIVHSEMPLTESHGLQLWVNLARKDKMVEPRYQELLAKDIPKVTKDGVTVTVIAGASLGIDSPVYTLTPTMYLDFRFEPNSKLLQPIPKGWNGFVYTLSGKAFFGPSEKAHEATAHHTLVLSNNEDEEGLHIETKEDSAHFVLIAGKPIGEPVVQYGPFVMTSQAEIKEAFADYQLHRNGFEHAATWRSAAAEKLGL